MARQPSESFDEHERPTTPRKRPFDLELPVQKGSGTRQVVTAEQLERYMKERSVAIDDRVTLPAPDQRPTLPEIPIPIDVDLSRLAVPSPRPAAGRPVPFATRLLARIDRQRFAIGLMCLVAAVSALLGFVVGRH